jgi:anti-sigma B factor antagonist
MSANNDLVAAFDEIKADGAQYRLYKLDGVDGGIVVNIHGFIDTYNTPQFIEKMSRVFEAGYKNVMFSCSGINYISSTGIGAFVDHMKSAKKKGGNTVIVEMPSKPKEVFNLLGFTNLLNFHATEEQGTEFLKRGEKKIEIFPKVIKCPVCTKKLSAKKAGRYRCPQCKTVLAIDPQGQLYLG